MIVFGANFQLLVTAFSNFICETISHNFANSRDLNDIVQKREVFLLSQNAKNELILVNILNGTLLEHLIPLCVCESFGFDWNIDFYHDI